MISEDRYQELLDALGPDVATSEAAGYLAFIGHNKDGTPEYGITPTGLVRAKQVLGEES